MQDVEFYDIPQDEIRKKTYEEDGRSFVLKKTDPYGFWSISLLKGPSPEQLKGTYTSEHDAVKAIKAYLHRQKVKNGNSSS